MILFVDLFLGGLLFATIAKVINGKNTIVATNRNNHVTPYHHAKTWLVISNRHAILGLTTPNDEDIFPVLNHQPVSW